MFSIRRAKYKDLDQIADFQLLMAKETENLSLNKEDIIEGIQAVFEDGAKGQYLVAVDGEDVLLGCLLITFEWSEWRNGTVLWIQSVYVREPFRGKGIYKMLYNHIKSKVEDDEDLKGIRLYVEKTNLDAQKVYHKMGMTNEHYELFEWLK